MIVTIVLTENIEDAPFFELIACCSGGHDSGVVDGLEWELL